MSTASTHVSSLKDRAYTQIRQRLERGEFDMGARISMRELSAVLEMSSIPIREAIMQLVSEGLLEHRRGIGTFVMKPSRQEIEDVYELREVIESHAARRAAEQLGNVELDEMRQAVELMDEIGRRIKTGQDDPGRDEFFGHWGAADAVFHQALLRRAGNQQAIKTMAGLRLMSRIFSRRSAAGRIHDLEKTNRLHKQILEAIERHEPVLAAKLMRSHIRRGCHTVLNMFDSLQREQESKQTPDSKVLTDLKRRLSESDEDSQ